MLEGARMVKLTVALLVLLGGAFAWNVSPASAQSQRGSCLASDSGIDLVLNGEGFDVAATAALAVADDAFAVAELRKAGQDGSEAVIASGPALYSNGVLAYNTWVPRESLGNAGDVVTVYASFNAPGQPAKRTCGILNVRL